MRQGDECKAAAPEALRGLLASSVPGRVRLRGAALRSPKALARLHEALQGCEGVTQWRANARVGSVLLRYEPQRLPPQQLFARLAQALPPDVPPPPAAATAQRTRARERAQRRRRMNEAVQCGMALSLGASLLAAGAGATRAHVLTGGVFMALLAQHLYTWRRPLLRPLGIAAGVR